MEIFNPSSLLSTCVGLIFFSQISSICWASDNESCDPTDCSQTPTLSGGAPFTCSIGRKKECDSFSYPALGKASSKMFPVQIASLNVYQKKLLVGSFPTLNISFELPKDLYSLQRTKAMKVEVNSPEDENYQDICRLFNFNNYTFTKHDVENPRVINYPCYYGLLEDPQVTYTFRVSLLPDDVQAKYYITLPVKSDNKWRSSLVMWQPDDGMEFWVMFDQHPGIHDYVFSLYTYDLGNCGVVEKGTLVETKTENKDGPNRVVFKNLKPKRYFLTLTLKNCDISCGMIKSHCVSIKEVALDKTSSGDIIKAPPGPGPRITPIDRQPNDQLTKIILGVFCGVTFGVILVVFLAYWYRDKGIRCPWPPREGTPGIKQTPTILLLYSPDFENHKNAVVKLANLLVQGFDCKVRFDMFELNYIQEWGLHSWLEDSINPHNFIIFVCTTGGRLQCSSNTQRLHFNKNHPLEDYFSTAVRLVARNPAIRRENVAVVSFSYATNADIPHQLDSPKKFVLRDKTDIETLYRYLRHGDKMPRDHNLLSSVEDFLTELAKAKTWLNENPNCFLKLAEPKHVEKHSNKSKSYHSSRLNNTLPVKQGSYLTDNPWLESCPLNQKNRSYSQPSSLHSSDELLQMVESSKSLACLDRQKSASGDYYDVRQSLLDNSHRVQIDSDSDEEMVTQSVSMSVDVHRTGQGVSSDLPPPGATWVSSSEESDLAQTVTELQRPGPDLEKIRKIVNPNVYQCPLQPFSYMWTPTKELKTIPLADPSPNSTNTSLQIPNSSYNC